MSHSGSSSRFGDAESNFLLDRTKRIGASGQGVSKDGHACCVRSTKESVKWALCLTRSSVLEYAFER